MENIKNTEVIDTGCKIKNTRLI